jgi:hypothetical protein
MPRDSRRLAKAIFQVTTRSDFDPAIHCCSHNWQDVTSVADENGYLARLFIEFEQAHIHKNLLSLRRPTTGLEQLWLSIGEDW